MIHVLVIANDMKNFQKIIVRINLNLICTCNLNIQKIQTFVSTISFRI